MDKLFGKVGATVLGSIPSSPFMKKKIVYCCPECGHRAVPYFWLGERENKICPGCKQRGSWTWDYFDPEKDTET